MRGRGLAISAYLMSGSDAGVAALRLLSLKTTGITKTTAKTV